MIRGKKKRASRMGNSRPKASGARSPSLPTAGVSESGDDVSPSPGRYPPLPLDSTYAVSSPKIVQGLVKVFIWSFLMERLVQWSLVGRSLSGRVGPLEQLGGTILAEGKGASDRRWMETRALLRGIATSVPAHRAPEDEEDLCFSEVDCTRVSINPSLPSAGFPKNEAGSPRKDQGEQVNQSMRHMMFYEYAAPAFAYLRGVYGVSESEYRRSFQENSRLIALASNSKSPQSFMFSEDGKYLIKTASESELESMLLLLPSYTGHVSHRRGSLLTQFFGIYRIADSTTRRSTVYVVSSNVFSTKKTLNEKYDLKGSIVGRRASPVPASGGVSRKPSVVMKDLDLESRGKLLLAPGCKSQLMAELTADAEFLSQQDIMDYSLLVGIHRPKPPAIRITGFPITALPLRVISITTMPARVLRRRWPFRPRPQIGIYPGREPGVSYYVGIIDVLQRYNARKILERGAKGVIYNRDEISAVPPDRYRERFLDFIDANTE